MCVGTHRVDKKSSVLRWWSVPTRRRPGGRKPPVKRKASALERTSDKSQGDWGQRPNPATLLKDRPRELAGLYRKLEATINGFGVVEVVTHNR